MNLREIREKKGLTMTKVGELAGMSLSMYSYIENGERRPSVESAKRLAEVLGIRWTDFYEDNDNHEH